MGKLVVSTNITLDGVVQDPDGKEGFRLGGWFETYSGGDLTDWAQLYTDEALAAQAVVLGRTSDEWFASRWLGRGGAWADKLNAMPKYVVSTTLEAPRWSNATVLPGDVPAQLAKVKHGARGDVLVYASYTPVRGLLEADLVDELRLVVFPVILGEGRRLFDGAVGVRPLTLLGTRRLDDGLVFLRYEVTR